MPELPELEIARERLRDALRNRKVEVARAIDPFVLRSVEPPLASLLGTELVDVDRFGKHLVLRFDSGLGLLVHLMRAGRLRLRTTKKPPAKRTLFLLEFEGGIRLEMTEAGTEHRASIRLVQDPDAVAEHVGGLEPLSAEFTVERLALALRRENRQTKNALRSRDVVAGIGNAYSDEILHAAKLSPMRMTQRLTGEEVARLHAAVVAVLREWIDRVRVACPEGSLPEKQPEWRKDFAVHGKPGRPCPVCGTPIERISYRDSETNYCPQCQSDGRVLADRRLSRLGVRRPIKPVQDE